jgi:hypothetical protein
MTSNSKPYVAVCLLGSLAFTSCGESPTRPANQSARQSTLGHARPNPETAEAERLLGRFDESIRRAIEYFKEHPEEVPPGMTPETFVRQNLERMSPGVFGNGRLNEPAVNHGFNNISTEEADKNYQAHQWSF